MLSRLPIHRLTRGRLVVPAGEATLADLAPGLFVSLDAAHVTLNGSDVSAMAAQDGTSVDFVQATAANQPVYLATGWGGSLPTVQCDGVTEYIHGDAAAASVAGDDVPFYVISSIQLVTNATWDYQWDVGYSGGANPSHAALVGGTLFWAARRSDDAGANATRASTKAIDTSRHTVEWVFHGTTVDIYVDGTAYLSGSALDLGVCNNLNQWTIGCKRSTGASNHQNMNVSKYAAWTPVPDAAQRAAIRAAFIAAYPVS